MGKTQSIKNLEVKLKTLYIYSGYPLGIWRGLLAKEAWRSKNGTHHHRPPEDF
jgi:hypothetical protein